MFFFVCVFTTFLGVFLKSEKKNACGRTRQDTNIVFFCVFLKFFSILLGLFMFFYVLLQHFYVFVSKSRFVFAAIFIFIFLFQHLFLECSVKEKMVSECVISVSSFKASLEWADSPS